MSKQLAVVSLILLASLAGSAGAQVSKPTMGARPAAMAPAAGAVEVKVVDEKGQALRAEALPKDVQANLERVRKAAESMTVSPDGGAGGGGAQRVKVTVRCSYPPLSCTITVSW
jgi:hypothetical protein